MPAQLSWDENRRARTPRARLAISQPIQLLSNMTDTPFTMLGTRLPLGPTPRGDNVALVSKTRTTPRNKHRKGVSVPVTLLCGKTHSRLPQGPRRRYLHHAVGEVDP